VKEPVQNKGFIITHAKEAEETTNESRNMGPGRYAIRHSLQEKKVQGFCYDDQSRKSRSINATINFLREK
jgi:hypothetical protein